MKRVFFFFWMLCATLFAEGKEAIFPPPETEEELYVSGDRFKKICPFVFEKKHSFNPRLVKEGDLVFVDQDELKNFFLRIHPKIEHRYILVSHNGDYHKNAIPGPFFLFLEDEKIIAWFGAQVNIVHPKVISLPLGIESNLWKTGNVQFYFDAIANGPVEKKHLLYLNFSLRNSPSFRSDIYLLFAQKPFCFSPQRTSWQEYVQGMAESKFVLCPKGCGTDSYRVWEALILGCIPIVEGSRLDSLYEGLPVVIVHNWDEVTESFLESKYQEMRKRKFSYEKLFISYWENRIKGKGSS